MSVHGERIDPAALRKAVDGTALRAMQRAREAVAPIVSHQTPRRTGATALALRPRVDRVPPRSYSLTVGAKRGQRHGEVTINDVVRWVTGGTGLYRTGAGRKHRITAHNPHRRLAVPDHIRWSVRGQKPDPFIARIRTTATPKVIRILTEATAQIDAATRAAL